MFFLLWRLGSRVLPLLLHSYLVLLSSYFLLPAPLLLFLSYILRLTFSVIFAPPPFTVV